MCNNRLIILFVLFFFIVTGIKAQQSFNYPFRHITQQDGLLHKEVHSIAQDDKGFIWIASTNGLQRYDGVNFINYTASLINPAEGLIPDLNMYADKKNKLLWVYGNYIYKKKEFSKNQFTLYNPGKLLKDSAASFIHYQEIKSNHWLLGQNAAYYFDSTSKKYILYCQNFLSTNTNYTSLIATDSSNNNTWIANYTQLLLFDKKNNKVWSSLKNPEHHPLLQSVFNGKRLNSVRLVMVDHRQNIWVTTWNDKLYRYDNYSKKVSTYSLAAIKAQEANKKITTGGLIVTYILEDDNHIIWVATENAGLLRYNSDKDNFDNCIAQEKNSNGIQYNYKINRLFQDREQNIWIGTDKGISIFNPYRQYFKSARHQENNLLSISKSEIQSCVQTTNGDIFIGTYGGGVGVYDKNLNFKKNIRFTGNPDKNKIWSFIQADDNTIWIGCQHGYLLINNTVTGATNSLHPPEMEGSTIRCMEKDNKGNIWFGLQNGKITKWDRKLDKFFSYYTGKQDIIKSTSGVLNILIDRAQHCWVSTEAGFKKFDLEKRIYTKTWLPDKNNPTGISGKTIQGIEEYNDSTLIIGTIYGGLNFFNKRTENFSHISIADGLPSNSIYAIKKDTAGYIWFITDYQLYKFNPVEIKIIPYSMEPGVINSSFKSNKFYQLQDGQWLIFTTTEVISFLPRRTEYLDNRQTKIEITGFKVFDKPLFIDSFLFENNPVRLSYKENFFTVEFAALNFSSLQQTNYYYRLRGTDDDWVNGGLKRFANYTDLQPGEYIFEVKAENGASTGDITSFKIIIAPPFWKTTWFKLVCLVLIAGITYVISKWRINWIHKEEKTKILFNTQMAEMEMKALRSQMNPHFMFNCINSIDAFIHSNDKYNATLYLNKFAKLLRNILDSSKQNTVTFSKDIDTLKLYVQLEELRHENKFKTSIIMEDELLNSDYKVPPLIIQPFIENAILHGLKNREDNNGLLQIEVKRAGDKIEYSIMDNGIGRKAAAHIAHNKESSYGMQMSYDRIRLFNKEQEASVQVIDLYDDSNATGTLIKVQLKIV